VDDDRRQGDVHVLNAANPKKTMKSFLRFAFSTAGLSVLLCSALRAEPALVGNKGFNGQTLDAEAVKAVLLGKKVTLGDSRVVIVIAKQNDGQEQFLQQAVGMSTSQFQNHWRRLFMTGGGSAPKIVESDADAAKLAAETAGAVTIVARAKAEGLVILAAAK
jgi:hypothetical protein